MKIQVGIGYSFYEVKSSHPYAKEISDGIHKGYAEICSLSILKIIKDMTELKTNEYLLYLFDEYQKHFSIDLAKEKLKNELIFLIDKCESEEETKYRNKLFKNRMRNFGSDDIVNYITGDVINKINIANNKYIEKIKNAINESLYE